MCTKQILELLKQAAVASYTATNTALYIQGPQAALQELLTSFINLVAPDLDGATKTKIAEGLAYGVIIPLAVGLLQSTHSSYSKVVHDYHAASPVVSEREQKQSASCWRKFANYGGAFLKASASCVGWYTLVNKVPYIGGPISAAVTTAFSVPGNIYTQIAFLSQDMKQQTQRMVASDEGYQVLGEPSLAPAAAGHAPTAAP